MNSLFLRAVKLCGEIPKNNYLSKLKVIEHLKEMGELTFCEPVTFFMGENGVGKSTLIEGIALAAGFNAEGGTKNFNFSTAETCGNLHEYLRLSRGISRERDGFFLRAESFFNVATNIDDISQDDSAMIENYGGVSLHARSHGESFLALVENRFSKCGLYILDEPEAALSPGSMLTFLCHMKELVRCGSQFIISTHSPILSAFPGARIYEIDGERIRAVSWSGTAHYRLYKRILNDPDFIKETLFEDD